MDQYPWTSKIHSDSTEIFNYINIGSELNIDKTKTEEETVKRRK